MLCRICFGAIYSFLIELELDLFGHSVKIASICLCHFFSQVEKLNHDFHRSKEEYRSLQDQMGHYQQALEEEGIPLSAQQRREQKIKGTHALSFVIKPFIVKLLRAK